jgi:hypothetical protein
MTSLGWTFVLNMVVTPFRPVRTSGVLGAHGGRIGPARAREKGTQQVGIGDVPRRPRRESTPAGPAGVTAK